MPSYLGNLRLFETSTIQKGSQYFSENRVEIQSSSGNVVRAVVKGSSRYNVKLVFDENKMMQSFSCSCPAAKPCKHIAATLYCLSSNDYINPNENSYYNPIARARNALLSSKNSPSFNYVNAAREITSNESIHKEGLVSLFQDYLKIPQQYGIEKEVAYRGISLYLSSSRFEDKDIRDIVEDCLISSAIPTYNKSLLLYAASYSKRTRPVFLLLLERILSSRRANVLEPLGEDAVIEYGSDISTRLIALCLQKGLYAFSDEVFLGMIEKTLEEDEGKAFSMLKNLFPRLKGTACLPLLNKLIEAGCGEEIRKMAKYKYLDSESFDDYKLYRSLLSDEEYQKHKKSIDSAVRFKPYFGAYCLYEHRDDLLNSSFLTITLEHIYLAFEKLDDKNRLSITKYFFHRLNLLLNNKKPSNELYYGLLILDAFHDGSLDEYLRNKSLVEKTKDSPKLRELYIRFVSRNQTLMEAGIYPYDL